MAIILILLIFFYINIYDSISLSPIILMEKNFKHEPKQTKKRKYLVLYFQEQHLISFVKTGHVRLLDVKDIF